MGNCFMHNPSIGFVGFEVAFFLGGGLLKFFTKASPDSTVEKRLKISFN